MQNKYSGYLRQAQVREMLGNISRTKLYNLRQGNSFPKAILAEGISLWRCEDISNWVESYSVSNDNFQEETE